MKLYNDISRCASQECPQKDQCARHLIPGRVYSDFHRPGKECDSFIQMEIIEEPKLTGNEWRKKQLEQNTEWAKQYRRKKNELRKKKYHGDEDYRLQLIRKAHDRAVRLKAWKEHLARVAAKAKSIRESVESSINKSYWKNKADRYGIIHVSRSPY